MNMQERRAQAQQRVAKVMAAVEIKPSKPRIRVRAGEAVTEDMIRLVLGIKPAPVIEKRWEEVAVDWQPYEGCACKKCKATTRVLFHDGRNTRCHWCTDGKGYMSKRDIAYYDKRVKDGTINRIVTL